MDNNQFDNDTSTIDLLELFNVLLSKAVFIICGAVIMALAVYFYDSFFVTPQYTSTTKVHVLSTENDSPTYNEVSMSSQLANDCVQLIQTRDVTEKTISDLGLRGEGGGVMTHSELIGKISVSRVADTRIITIKVSDTDPARAQKIADKLVENAMEHINNDVLHIDAVSQAEKASLPTSPSSPHKKRDTVIGGAAGLIIVSAVVLTVHFMDNTIKTSEDIEKYLGLSSLGVIPMSEDESKAVKAKKKKNAGAAAK